MTDSLRPAGPGLARVRGSSMRPTLADGDLLLVRWGATPSTGAVVVVRLPARPGHPDRPVSVKRLAGRVDDGWWVERDNPAEGADSWLVGAVPDADLLGVAVARIWPRPRRIANRSQ